MLPTIRNVFLCLFLVAGSTCANAQTFFPNNATVNYALTSYTDIGYASESDWLGHRNPTSPTVSFVSGASISPVYGLEVDNSSRINISDGANINTTIYAENNSLANINGGIVASVFSGDSSHVVISGGNVGSVVAGYNSLASIAGGTFPGTAVGRLGNGIQAFLTGHVNISGGTFTGINVVTNSSGESGANNSGVISISGGTFSKCTIGASDTGTLNIRGGNFIRSDSDFVGSTKISATADSTVNFYGSNLVLFKTRSAGEYKFLSGTLQDGNDVTGLIVFLDQNAKTNLRVSKLPLLDLTMATTTDAQSVKVVYTISQRNITQPLLFDVYRSDQPSLTGKSVLIGSEIIYPSADATDLKIGTHAVKLIAGTPLVPDPALPYVVVYANEYGTTYEDNGSVNITYFRKYLLGGVVHGLSLDSSSDADTIAWMKAMHDDLLLKCGFDNVLCYYWLSQSRAAKPNQAINAGNGMYYVLLQAARNMITHPGDVVDLHLIGHSRGTVVCSQVLVDLIARPSALWSGSYIEATLLDPHPANTLENGLMDYTLITGAGLTAATLARAFQAQAQDPEILLPKFPNIMSVDIWCQHTPVSSLSLFSQPTERILNLWGENQSGNHIQNLSAITPKWNDLTDKSFTDAGQTLVVGHSEVHEYYRLLAVDAGFVH